MSKNIGDTILFCRLLAGTSLHSYNRENRSHPHKHIKWPFLNGHFWMKNGRIHAYDDVQCLRRRKSPQTSSAEHAAQICQRHRFWPIPPCFANLSDNLNVKRVQQPLLPFSFDKPLRSVCRWDLCCVHLWKNSNKVRVACRLLLEACENEVFFHLKYKKQTGIWVCVFPDMTKHRSLLKK